MARSTRTTEHIVQTPGAPAMATAETTVVNQQVGSGAKAELIVRYLFGVLEALLALRFGLSLLGANTDNGFANLIYTVTYPFVAPFFGLFGYKLQYGVARFEFETLVAMVVYGLIAYAITRLMRISRA